MSNETVQQIEDRLRLRHLDPVAFAQHAASDIAFLLSLVPVPTATLGHDPPFSSQGHLQVED